MPGRATTSRRRWRTTRPFPGLPATDLSAARLGEHAILLTYGIAGPDGSLRSSVWVREPGSGWVVRFHQGTGSPSVP